VEPGVLDARARLHHRAVDAARLATRRLREDGSIGELPFQRLEQELDWAELGSAPPGAGE
jgi:hypothetical protein